MDCSHLQMKGFLQTLESEALIAAITWLKVSLLFLLEAMLPPQGKQEVFFVHTQMPLVTLCFFKVCTYDLLLGII